MRNHVWGVLIMAGLLSACATHSSIQREYISMRDTCQSVAETKIGNYVPEAGSGESVKDRNAQLVTLFSDCMFTQGWTVATPDRERTNASVIPDPQHPQNQSSDPAVAARPTATTAPSSGRSVPVENQSIYQGNSPYSPAPATNP